jgi:hypothetical protein
VYTKGRSIVDDIINAPKNSPKAKGKDVQSVRREILDEALRILRSKQGKKQ